jgi:predicted transcriptional regulator
LDGATTAADQSSASISAMKRPDDDVVVRLEDLATHLSDETSVALLDEAIEEIIRLRHELEQIGLEALESNDDGA